MDKRIIQISEHYGYQPQNRQLIEEMAELTVALNKHWRALIFGCKNISDEVRLEHLTNNVVEEIADVEIMLEQMKYFFNCQANVEEIKERKITRQIERIEKERK